MSAWTVIYYFSCYPLYCWTVATIKGLLQGQLMLYYDLYECIIIPWILMKCKDQPDWSQVWILKNNWSSFLPINWRHLWLSTLSTSSRLYHCVVSNAWGFVWRRRAEFGGGWWQHGVEPVAELTAFVQWQFPGTNPGQPLVRTHNLNPLV